MYSMYASDPRARINLGIRRRLAPLLENDAERIKLMNSLLLSMPGTPVLYYGDEIGMGDNIFLGDRDGVRTPMQWSSDRNGGFSRADPQRLYLPPIQDPIYGYEAVNVEAQGREKSSMLAWTRRLLAVRSSSQAFGRGRFTMLHPGNRKVLAYVREHGGEVILCVANLSRMAQPVELALAAWKTRVPVEMTGRTSFPPVGELPYLLTLPGYGFFWFRLSTDAPPPGWHNDWLPLDELPVAVLFDGWNSFFRQRVVPWRIALAEKTRRQLECELLPPFVNRQRWHSVETTAVARVALAESALLKCGSQQWQLALAELQPRSVQARCFLPLGLAFDDDGDEQARTLSAAAVGRVRQQARTGVLADAMADEAFCRALVLAIGARRVLKADGGSFRCMPGQRFVELVTEDLQAPMPLRRFNVDGHSLSIMGDHLRLKCYRSVPPGPNPELDLGRHLTEVLGYTHGLPVAGSLDFVAGDGTVHTLALLQRSVTHQGNAWTSTLDQLVSLLEVTDGAGADAAPSVPCEVPVDRVQALARRVGELHLALARKTGSAAFDPEPVLASDLQRWAGEARATCNATVALLAQQGAGLAATDRAKAERITQALPRVLARIDEAARATPSGLKTWLHGDLCLDNVLVCRDDFVIVGMAGASRQSFEERRTRHSAWRDVADLLRSFARVRQAALERAAPGPGDATRIDAAARAWAQQVRHAFIAAYMQTAPAAAAQPGSAAGGAATLLDLFELSGALQDAHRELALQSPGLGAALAVLAELADPTD